MRAYCAGALLGLLTACAAAEPEEPTVVRMVHLEHVKVTDIAICLRSDVPEGAGIEVLKFGELNAIMLQGTEAQCEAIERIIRSLDRSAADR